MKPIHAVLHAARTAARAVMKRVARVLHAVSGGRITPNAITIVGLLAHVPIAWFIMRGDFLLAAVLLVIFGLFDALDGELARLQNRASAAGMLLDASTDRMKEAALYVGIAYYIAAHHSPALVAVTVIACSSSLIVSYVKAKGETAVAKSNLTTYEINYLFQDGLMNFELRMATIALGLVLNQLPAAVIFIALTATLNAFSRLITISRKIS